MQRRDILSIDEDKCDGCGLCVTDCAEGAIAIIDGKARIVSDSYCDGLGACIGACPQGALTIIQREAPPFDEEAAMQHVAAMSGDKGGHGASPTALAAHPHAGIQPPALADARSPGQCSGDGLQPLSPIGPAYLNGPTQTQGAQGAHGVPDSLATAQPPAAKAPGGCPGLARGASPWPVKLRLVPPDAPFLQGADLILAADCAAPVMPGFHIGFARGAVVLIACPKFEDRDALREKLTAIFRAAKPGSCTVMRMEVPCCAGIHLAAREAHHQAQADFPLRELTISRNGQAQ